MVAGLMPTVFKAKPNPNKNPPLLAGLFILVGAAGFEPTLTESESGVLPLNYAPMRGALYNLYFHFAIKNFYNL